MKTTSSEKSARFTRLGHFENRTIVDAFRDAVAAVPQRPALADPPNRQSLTGEDPRSLTYAELAHAVDDLSRRFHVAGLRQDDIVILQLPNVVEIVVSYLALAQLGVIISPVAMQYGRHELREIASVLKPAAYVSVARFKGQDFARTHGPAFSPDVRKLVFGDGGGDGMVQLDSAAPESGSDAAEAYLNDIVIAPDDVFTICWTSGTTGQPKGVPRSHNHWFAIAAGSRFSAGIRDGDRMVCPFPFINMASIGGFLFNWLASHGLLALHHPLDLSVFLRQIQDIAATYTIAPPALLNMLLKEEDLLARCDLSSLRVIASGGAPLSPWMITGFRDRMGIDIINIFGSNEGVSLISDVHDAPEPDKRATVFPRFGVATLKWSNPIAGRIETRLIDPASGEEVTRPGDAGELVIAGPTVFDGYFNAPEANAAAFTADGFFRSGDLFEIDAEDERYYRFVGRCKDIIIRGGMKISPDELDRLLLAHPGIADAAVVGMPDEVMGERICAVVVPRPDAALSLRDVTDHLRALDVAVFKLPERLEIIDSLPRNALGKVLRRELRDRFSR